MRISGTANAAGALGPLLIIIFILGGGFYEVQATVSLNRKNHLELWANKT